MKLSISNMNKTLTTAGLTILMAVGLQAQAKLALAKVSENTVSINMENTMPVAGLQFTVNGSSNLALNNVKNSGRTQSGNWQVHQNQVNDSTINVVIINSGIADIPAGEGAIAEFTITDNGSTSSSRVTLNKVVVADQFAQKVAVEISNIEWTSAIAQAQEKEFTLEQNYPNPFNPSTTITIRLPLTKRISLRVYDILGREVHTLINDEEYTAGSHQVFWDGRNSLGVPVGSGTYFYRLEFGNFSKSMKMMLVK